MIPQADQITKLSKNPSSPSLHPTIYDAIAKHLAMNGKKILFTDGVCQFVDSTEKTPFEVIEQVWADKWIRFADNGDLLLLHADRVKNPVDTSKVRRRLEDTLRKKWSQGDILEIACAVGVLTS